MKYFNKIIVFLVILLVILFIISPAWSSDQPLDYDIFDGEEELVDGYVLSDDGDIDGDNLSDVLIGMQNANFDADNNGVVYLVLGKDIQDHVIDLTQATYIFPGENDEDQAGSYVMFLDDEDEDNLDEVLIGFGNNEDEQVILSTELSEYAVQKVVPVTTAPKYGGTTVYVGVGKSIDCTLNPEATHGNNTNLFFIFAAALLLILKFRVKSDENY